MPWERQASAGRARQRGGSSIALAVVLAGVASGIAVQAADANGSYSIFLTSTDDDGFETDLVEQQASVGLFQRFTPYVSARASYNYFDLGQETSLDTEQSITNQQGRLDLLYNRERVSARLQALRQTTDTGVVTNDFTRESVLASVAWRPDRGPQLFASFRDESNVADESVFGRGNTTQTLTFEALHDARWGGAAYSFRQNELQNRSNGLGSTQRRHELRAFGGGSFLDGGVSLDGSASISRVNRDTKFGSAELADVVPAREALFLVDTTPEIGELDPAPGLIDGDTQSPSAPGIDVGGANTYRNLGLDFGVTSQISRLEITVDTVSSSDVVWQIYRSPDNLTWQRVGSESSSFDVALLRYTVVFPQFTDRYVKAVNVTANSQPSVRVTELRGLLEVASDAVTQGLESTLYRADAGALLRHGPRVNTRIEFGFSNDENVAAGFVRRDYHALYAGMRVNARLAEDWSLGAGYRYSDTELRRDPVLLRTENSYDVRLVWTPLDAVNGILSAQLRDESDSGRLLQKSRAIRLLFSTAFLPDLRLISDGQLSLSDDPASGFDRRSWSWRETLSAQPTERWQLFAGFSLSRYRTEATDPDTQLTPLRSRDDARIGTTWSPTSMLTLGASWSVGRDDASKNVSTSYNLSYAPGPKFNLSAVHQQFETRQRRGTASDNLTLRYQLNRRTSLTGSLYRSRSEDQGVQTDELTSARAGLRITI